MAVKDTSYAGGAQLRVYDRAHSTPKIRVYREIHGRQVVGASIDLSYEPLFVSQSAGSSEKLSDLLNSPRM